MNPKRVVIRPHAASDVVKAARPWECLHCENYIQKGSLYLRIKVKGRDDPELYPRYGSFCGVICFTIFINDFFQGYYWWVNSHRHLFERLADTSPSFRLTKDAKEYLIQQGWRLFPVFPKVMP